MDLYRRRMFYLGHARLGGSMNIKPFLLVAGLCMGFSGSALSQLNLMPSADGPMQYASPGPTIHQDFTFPPPAVSLAHNGYIQVTFSAPPGYAWQFDATGPLDYCFSYGTPLSGDVFGMNFFYYNIRNPYNFDFVSGRGNSVSTASGPGSLPQAWESEAGFGFDFAVMFDGPVEFTEMSITLPQPEEAGTYDAYMRQLPLSPLTEA
jgi:hypothetical protein